MTHDHHGEKPHINGDESGPTPAEAIERSQAIDIMADPATAAGVQALMPENPVLTSPLVEGRPADARLLNALPGIMGGLTEAIFHQHGKALPAMLIIFTEVGAMHATNCNTEAAHQMLFSFVDSLREGQEPIASANDGPQGGEGAPG